jgi:hypothetical protein
MEHELQGGNFPAISRGWENLTEEPTSRTRRRWEDNIKAVKKKC